MRHWSIELKGWKFLFWVLFVWLVFDLVTLPFSDYLNAYDFIGIVIGALFLVPYYGYAYQTAIGWEAIWKVVLLINVAVFLYLAYIESVIDLIDSFQWDLAILLVVSLLIGVLLLIPNYRYAFKSQNLWQHGA